MILDNFYNYMQSLKTENNKEEEKQAHSLKKGRVVLIMRREHPFENL